MKSEAFSFSGYGSARAKSGRRGAPAPRFALECLETRRLLDATSALAHLDPSFGQDGAAAPLPAGMSSIEGSYQHLTPAGGGKFYAVAFDSWKFTDFNMARAAFELMRINADGSLDPTFGQGGAVRITHYDPTDVAVPWFTPGVTWHSEYDALTVGSVIVQPDGKVLLAVQAVPHGPPDPWLLMRFNADGTTDTGFGDAGMITLPLPDNRNAPTAWIQADGKIDLIGVDAYRDGGAVTGVLQQFNSDGSPDPTFGTDGSSAITLQPDNSFAAPIDPANGYFLGDVIGGAALPDGGSIAYLVDSQYACNASGGSVSLIAMRFDATGNLIASPTLYGTTSQTGYYLSLNTTMQPDGKAIVLDATDHLIRFNTDGSPDTSFDAAAATETLPTGFSIRAFSVEPDGEILVTVADPSSILQGLQRLNADGSTDATFAGGQTTFGLGDHESINSVLTLADGSTIVSVNDSYGGGAYDTSRPVTPKGAQLLRLQPDGGVPSSFDDQAAEAAAILATTPPPPPPTPDPIPLDDGSDPATDAGWTDPTTTDGSDDPTLINDGTGDGSIDYGQGDPSADPTGAQTDGSPGDATGYFDSPADATVWNPNGIGSVYDSGM